MQHNCGMTLYQNKYRVESPRLRGWDYRSPGWYFVTICTRDHLCILGNVARGQMQLSPSGEVAESELRNLPHHYVHVSIDHFIVMPNHIHAIVVIEGQHRHSTNPETRTQAPSIGGLLLMPPKAGSLSAIIRSYKAGVTRRCHEMGLKTFEWQSGFYDHIVRANTSLQAIRDYIEKNPANWPHDPEDQP
jgi:REP element-mobilizing transposase RayT